MSVPGAGEPGRERRARRRALKHLRSAFAQAAGEQLSPEWVKRDPDMRVFREPYPLWDPPQDPAPDPDWLAMLTRPEPTRDKEKRKKPEKVEVHALEPREKTVAMPPRPWNPVIRIAFWGGFAVALVVLLWLARTTGAHPVFPVAALLGVAFSAYRVAIAVNELRYIPGPTRVEQAARSPLTLSDTRKRERDSER
jgi:hypothetical protein